MNRYTVGFGGVLAVMVGGSAIAEAWRQNAGPLFLALACPVIVPLCGWLGNAARRAGEKEYWR